MLKPMPLDKRVNYRLHQVSQRWSGLVVAMARSKYQLNASAMKTLSVIACYQPISPSELVERTSSDSPKVARAVGHLVEQGLIERVPDRQDGRRALLRVTLKGAKINADIDKVANLVEEKIVSGLSETDQRSLYDILDKIESIIHQQLHGTTWSTIVNEE